MKFFRHSSKQGSAPKCSSQQMPSPTSFVQKLGASNDFCKLEVIDDETKSAVDEKYGMIL